MLELLGGEEGLNAGLTQCRAEFIRIGTDAHLAETRGIDLSEACTDHDNYPHLAEFHYFVEDVVQLSLPPVLAGWAKRVISRGEPPFFEELRRALVRLAATDPNPIQRALWRVLVLEGVRLNLLVMKRLGRGEFESVGVRDEDPTVIAEREMTIWLESHEIHDPAVRPLRVMVEAAARGLLDHAAELRDSLSKIGEDFLTTYRLRAKLESKLVDAEASDAVLVRNAVAGSTGDRHFTVERLKERHKVLLGDKSRNTLDKQASRIMQKLERDPTAWPRRKGESLLDIVEDALDDEN